MSKYWIIIFLVFGSVAKSQTLFSVEEKEISAPDFIQVYEKNKTSPFSDGILSIDEYLDLFVNFHLKVYEAEQQGLHEEEKFIKEFGRYFKQLADNQIANGDVTEEMIQEVYHRMKNEVRVSHILVAFPQNTENPKAEAYTKALQIIDSLESGADFKVLAKKYSDDPSVNANQGDMGWFKAFKMVTPFEDESYALEVGETSMPVETQFGYHIIQKTDARNSMGKILVGHIMLYTNADDSEEKAKKIKEIHNRILQGESFEELAKQFSEDKSSAENGGVMMPFEIGGLNSQTFENEAFSLSENGQLSNPFKTRFGWHIIKRLDTEPVASYEELKDFISKRIKTSDRAKLLNDRIQQNLSQYHNVEVNQDAIDYFSDKATELILKSKWEYNAPEEHSQMIAFSIDEKKYSWEDLGNYLNLNQRGLELGQPKPNIVSVLTNNYLYAELVEQHKHILMDINPAFKSSVNEYRDGLLLYEIMEREVWEKAKKDSLGLEKFYQSNKEKYISELELEVTLFSTNNNKTAKKIKKQLRKNKRADDVAEVFSEEAIFSAANWKKINAPSLPKNIKLEKNKPTVYKHNSQFLVVIINDIKEPRQLELDEVKGQVISDYQLHVEALWLSELKNKYNVSINEDMLQEIRKKLE